MALALACGSLEAAPVKGESTDFPVQDGLVEQCIRITPFPGAAYSKQDLEKEKFYCGLDVNKLALCPKLWSTSPATILYEIDEAVYQGDYAQFESQHCDEGTHTRKAALSEPAVYKISVNGKSTSATFAPASWVYYHFSRYFQTSVRVPVAVYRSMDAESHNQRVVKPALKIVAGRHGLGMLTAGWKFVNEVETGQLTGTSANEVLTDDGRQIFGVFLTSKGDRYGPEVNGTRESGWGSGQNNDFQQTAPFLALRSELQIEEAAKSAIHEARRNPKMAKALPADTSIEQVVFWMQDVLEITLLDFILGQQDRIGNIDYNWHWYWIEDGTLQSRPALGKETPEDISGFKPSRLKQSAINDNDAGVRTSYADFAAKTHMLEGLRHYDPALYRRLGQLAADFMDEGPAFRWLTGDAGLSDKEARAISRRTIEAFDLLQSDCENGNLQLDLVPAEFLMSPGIDMARDTASTGVSCEVIKH